MTIPVRLLVSLLLAFTGMAAAPHDAASSSERTLLLSGRVFDGITPTAQLREVLIRDGRVACIAPLRGCRAAASVRRIALGPGQTAVPGLIDLHVHARSSFTRHFRAAGVTTIRDTSNEPDELAALRRAPDAPRLVHAGRLIDGPGSFWGPRFTVETAEAARAAVDLQAAEGASFIKLYNRLPIELLRAAAERARERGLAVTADLDFSSIDALQASEAGVTGLEHGSGLSRALRTMDAARLSRTLVGRGIYIVPTLTALCSHTPQAQQRNRARTFPELPAAVVDEWRGREANLPPMVHAYFAKECETVGGFLSTFRAAGGLIGAGTDAPNPFIVPGASLHDELEELVTVGLTPADAMMAATGNAAKIIGRDDVGVLREGAFADIIVVDGNPLEEIAAIRKISRIFFGGRPADRHAAR